MNNDPNNSRGMSMSGHVTVYRLEEKQRFWKRILIVDDDEDATITFKAGIEDNNIETNKRIEIYTSNNPVGTLSEFRPNFYVLLLTDINMPYMNGFELSERILAIDINVKICFMSSGEINREALREVYPGIMLYQKASHYGLFG